MNIWGHVVANLNPDIKERLSNKTSITISRKEYEVFCKEFVFDSIKGESFGEAFCKRFDIQDSAISILRSEGLAKELIQSLGYIK